MAKKKQKKSMAKPTSADEALRKRLKKAVKAAEKAAERAERAAGKAKKRAKRATAAVTSGASSPASDSGTSEPRTGVKARPVVPPRPPKAQSVSDLHELTRVQLLERARTADIRGRSGMSKDELVTALRKAH